MPHNSQRRTEIVDTAIDILADAGVGGLTHRQIDERAGLPAGTTSNYFRTRLALLEATAARTAELHWQHVEALQTVIGVPMSRDSVVAMLARMISDPDGQHRRRTLARFELFLEGTRRPELQPFINKLHAAAIESARVVLHAAGIDPSTEQIDELTRVLNGLLFSNMTISRQQSTADDPTGAVGRLLQSVLELPNQTF
jgi:DNA-binding transcriptional regulator YbjK